MSEEEEYVPEEEEGGYIPGLQLRPSEITPEMRTQTNIISELANLGLGEAEQQSYSGELQGLPNYVHLSPIMVAAAVVYWMENETIGRRPIENFMNANENIFKGEKGRYTLEFLRYLRLLEINRNKKNDAFLPT